MISAKARVANGKNEAIVRTLGTVTLKKDWWKVRGGCRVDGIAL